MEALTIVVFLIFFLCIIAHFAVLKQIRDRLIDHHPEEFLAAERSSFWLQSGLGQFIWRRGHKALNDPELDRYVRTIRILYAIAFLAWLGLLAASVLTPGNR